ncbi:MAG: asparagine synthase (glutamine-hydrolyzing) [Chitinophagaceae bacterium]
MCGIAGILNFNGQPPGEETIRRMTGAMAHRGPDADGFFSENEIALGHRRLSIIDLSCAANQPFTDNSGRYVMVFNGEMYNFGEVKPLLDGYAFKTTGDTEVLIAAFAKWGPACVQYFKGMFVFAVWDKEQKELTIVRDRLGVKPLYYFINENQCIFASEIRSILTTGLVERKINQTALLDFFFYQSVGSPHAIVEGIEQLEAGSYITIKDGKWEKHVYWDVTRPNADFDFEDKINVQHQIRSLLRNAVERRLVSDVPVGAFLSGGIDSSVIVGLMAEVSSSRPNTFTVAFNEKEFDESPYADAVAKKFNTHHTNIPLKPTDFLEELENALSAMDTPSGDGVNSYVVSKAIRNAGITVALSGVGGDELFAGYPIFRQFIQFNGYRSWWKGMRPLRSLMAGVIAGDSSKKLRIRQILKADSPSIENLYPVLRQIIAPESISLLTNLAVKNPCCTGLQQQLSSIKENLHHLPLLSQVSAAEYLGYTQHTLLKDMDQMSMAVSLEVREPFFDHDLVEFVLKVPDILKMPVYPKSLLVESVKPMLPDDIVHRPKQGFLFPWSVWMKNDLKQFCEDRLNALSQRSFINSPQLKTYWKRFLKGDPSVRWAELWLFVVLEYWMEKNRVHE